MGRAMMDVVFLPHAHFGYSEPLAHHHDFRTPLDRPAHVHVQRNPRTTDAPTHRLLASLMT
ncbi:hypothetical protein D9615_009835 [Tricholomella constricta]|uniref:Uncharacterized protein n=1 Tax=Tricholomella constricta TaxID=117010 RepID=A0A8H5GWP2_9AGAR|nr:hypothetical protein D9615_009835 [Tricholomella constricta]